MTHRTDILTVLVLMVVLLGTLIDVVTVLRMVYALSVGTVLLLRMMCALSVLIVDSVVLVMVIAGAVRVARTFAVLSLPGVAAVLVLAVLVLVLVPAYTQ